MRIEIRNVGKRFNRRPVFEAVSFDVGPGDVVGITGKNGAGKSTLLRIIGGVLSPTTGTVTYIENGTAIPPERLHSRIGYVAPYLTLYEEFSAEENLRLYARIRGHALDRSHARELIARVGLPVDRRDPIHSFSSGMKQRMKLLFATVHEPPVLLLDEPVSNLDADGMDVVYRIVEAQRVRGCVVIATNDASDIAHCDRTVDIPRVEPRS